MIATRSTLLGLLLVGAGVVFAAVRPGRAEDPPYEMRYLSVVGDGSNAKAWFEGAPPSGARVQEALDRFAREGFRFSAITPSWRQGSVSVSTAPGPTAPGATSPDPTYVLVLERNRR